MRVVIWSMITSDSCSLGKDDKRNKIERLYQRRYSTLL